MCWVYDVKTVLALSLYVPDVIPLQREILPHHDVVRFLVALVDIAQLALLHLGSFSRAHTQGHLAAQVHSLIQMRHEHFPIPSYKDSSIAARQLGE